MDEAKSVMLCGLGPSKYQLMEGMVQHTPPTAWDELWTVNTGARLLPRADKVFVMDDIADYCTRYPGYCKALRDFEGRVIGQTAFPSEAEALGVLWTDYPLREVIEHWGRGCDNWLHTISIGYVLAYAGFAGVERLFLSGIDCSWPNRPDLTEAGNAVVCYWIGRLEQSGCEVIINSESALNETNQRERYGYRKLYGYLRQPS